MAYSPELAERIRALLATVDSVTERKMFGGLCFLVQGNMCCGIVGAELMLRLGNDGTAAALREPDTRPMDFTGKVLRSMLYVEAPGIATERQLKRWLERAAAFAATLPAK